MLKTTRSFATIYLSRKVPYHISRSRNGTELFWRTILAFPYEAFTSVGDFQMARFAFLYQVRSACSEFGCFCQNSRNVLNAMILMKEIIPCSLWGINNISALYHVFDSTPPNSPTPPPAPPQSRPNKQPHQPQSSVTAQPSPCSAAACPSICWSGSSVQRRSLAHLALRWREYDIIYSTVTDGLYGDKLR